MHLMIYFCLFPFSPPTEQSAFDAFRIMMEAKLSALPVIDKHGKVLANISNSDLKVTNINNITPNERVFVCLLCARS